MNNFHWKTGLGKLPVKHKVLVLFELNFLPKTESRISQVMEETRKQNQVQSNLRKDGIADLSYSPGGSRNLQ